MSPDIHGENPPLQPGGYGTVTQPPNTVVITVTIPPDVNSPLAVELVERSGPEGFLVEVKTW